MAWTIEFDHRALKTFAKLEQVDQRRVRRYLAERVSRADSPRSLGKALVGSRFGELWRYRVGDFRIICQLKDEKMLVLVLEVDHRSDIYRHP